MFQNRLFSYPKLYFILLILIAASLPISRFGVSLFEIVLCILWISDVYRNKKVSQLFSNKQILLFISIYAIHLFGLIYSHDWYYGLNDLRIKFPLILFPLFFATNQLFDSKKLHQFISFFLLALFAKSIETIFFYFFNPEIAMVEFREITGSISHIRFSLMIVAAIFIKTILMVQFPHPNKFKIPDIILIIFLACYLFFLKSMTGIVILFICIIPFTLWLCFFIKKRGVRILIIFSTIALLSFSTAYLIICIQKFYKTDEIQVDMLKLKTINGNNYLHDFTSTSIENGHYVNINICEKELEENWNKRSLLKYKEKDRKNNELKYTILRYLTSKNFTKDSIGIWLLNTNDITNIENGMSNYIYANPFSIFPRIYQIIWEVDNYIHTGKNSGHSVTQRIEFLQIALHIIHSNPFFGVGTGDVALAFKTAYREVPTNVSQEFQYRTHNQFITFMVTFGIPAFIWILYVLFQNILYAFRQKNILFLFFSAVILLSFLNEDTLESQAGATFFGLFYALLLWGINLNNKRYA